MSDQVRIHEQVTSGVRRFRDVSVASITDSVNVKSFGAVGDGVSNDTEAFNKAFAHLSSIVTRPKKLICQGSFVIDLETIWNVSDDTILDFTGATFVPSSTDTSLDFITIKGKRNGSADKTSDNPEMTTALSVDAVAGSISVTLDSVAGIEEGDLLVFVSDEIFQKESGIRKTQEPARVSSVNGSVVYLDAPLLCDYTEAAHQAGGGSGFPVVWHFKTAQNVSVIGGTWIINERCSKALKINEINLGTFRNQKFVNPLRRGMELRYCSGDTHYDHVLERPGEDAANDSSPTPTFGYGVMHTYCCYSRVFGGQGRRGWHSYDATQGQRDIVYSGFIGQMDSQSLSSHADCISFKVENSRIEGKNCIHCRARYNYIENSTIRGATDGAGIEWGGDSYELHISGVTFDGSFGNSYSISATSGLEPTNATVKANSKAVIRNNKFIGTGGNISVLRGASKIVFEENFIECDDFNTSVSKISFLLFAGGVGSCSKNTVINPVGGGRSNFSIQSELGAEWQVCGNIVIGENPHGSGGNIFSFLGDDGAIVSLNNNSVSSDLVTNLVKISSSVTFKTISNNNFMCGNAGAVFLSQNGDKESTVTRLSFNNVSSATSLKTSEAGSNVITITKDLNNIFSDT